MIKVGVDTTCLRVDHESESKNDSSVATYQDGVQKETCGS